MVAIYINFETPISEITAAKLEKIEFKKRSSDVASKMRLKKLFDFYNTPN